MSRSIDVNNLFKQRSLLADDMEHAPVQYAHDEDHPSFSERCLCKGTAFHDFMARIYIEKHARSSRRTTQGDAARQPTSCLLWAPFYRQTDANAAKVQCVICEDWFHGLCLKPALANEKAVEVWEKQHGMEWTCPNCMGADEDSD